MAVETIDHEIMAMPEIDGEQHWHQTYELEKRSKTWHTEKKWKDILSGYNDVLPSLEEAREYVQHLSADQLPNPVKQQIEDFLQKASEPSVRQNSPQEIEKSRRGALEALRYAIHFENRENHRRAQRMRLDIGNQTKEVVNSIWIEQSAVEFLNNLIQNSTDESIELDVMNGPEMDTPHGTKARLTATLQIKANNVGDAYDVIIDHILESARRKTSPVRAAHENEADSNTSEATEPTLPPIVGGKGYDLIVSIVHSITIDRQNRNIIFEYSSEPTAPETTNPYETSYENIPLEWVTTIDENPDGKEITRIYSRADNFTRPMGDLGIIRPESMSAAQY